MPNIGLPEMKMYLGIRWTRKHAPTDAYAVAPTFTSVSASLTTSWNSFLAGNAKMGLPEMAKKKMDLPEMPNMGLPEMKTCLGIRRTQKHAPTNAYAIAFAPVSSSAKETRLRLRRTTGKEPKRTKKTRKRKRMGKEQSHPTLSWWLVRFPLFCIHQRLHSPTPTFSSQPLWPGVNIISQSNL